MPSWNIHTAHVERLLSHHRAEDLGIANANAFLFGNYVPDIYLGFMVRGITYRIDYCMTHLAEPSMIPVPDADKFWDLYLYRGRPSAPESLSLTLGAWAHLVADRYYNGRFRTFRDTHDVPDGEELRKRKQADFDLFGRSMGISTHVRVTPELVAAADEFRPYSILKADVERAVEVADDVVSDAAVPSGASYQLLDDVWLRSVFDACDERLATWLGAWQALEERGLPAKAVDVRKEAGLPPRSQIKPLAIK